MGAIEPEKIDTAGCCLESYYLEPSKDFYIRNRSGRYIRVKEAALKRELRGLGIEGKVDKGGLLSEQEVFISNCMHERDIVFAGPMAGYRQGFYEDCGSRFLVTNSPVLPAPTPGDWPVLKQFLTGLLDDQAKWFYGWIKIAYETVAAGKRRTGQALVLAGPRECGKSLLQNIITKILGGRSAKPFQFMCAGTAFNSDLFAAEHLMLEDEMPSCDLKSRRALGAAIKSFTANEEQRCHGKGQQPFMARPFWRVTVSVNDEPENLMVLPPLDESLEDKMIILRAHKNAMPMPTASVTDREKFWNRLMLEVPHMLHDLCKWTIPASMSSERYGVGHYHNHEIVNMVNELSPEMKLIQLIDKALAYNLPYQGSSVDLEHDLKGEDSVVAAEARSLLYYNTSCGQYLARLEKKMPHRVSSHIQHGGKKIWRIVKEAETQEYEEGVI